MTTEELLALPDDGTERWLLMGQLREKRIRTQPSKQSRTLGRARCRIMATSVYALMKWLKLQQEPRGEILCGEAGCRFGRNPDTTVGIDVVYIAANLVMQESEDTTLIDGVPTLIIEILSPSDAFKEIKEKIDLYQKFRVPLIWVIDPHDRTITVYRLDAEPELVNIRQELIGDPHLPGFRVAAAEIFA